MNVLLLLILLAPSAVWAADAAPPAQDLKKTFTCQRFKSSCTGQACLQRAAELQKDTEHKILAVKKTEFVEYAIHSTQAIETLKGEQIDPTLKRALTITYTDVETTPDKIFLGNKDKNNTPKDKVEILTSTGFYLDYQLHTDGSIKEVPIGEPYAAYFGWCDGFALPPEPAAPAATAP